MADSSLGGGLQRPLPDDMLTIVDAPVLPQDEEAQSLLL